MPPSLTDKQIRRLRLRAQRLDTWAADGRASAEAVAAVVRMMAGLQAQYADAAALAVRARASGPAGPTAADVEHARVEVRAIVRTWCQRGTLHLVAADDLAWLLALLGPDLVRHGRRRRLQLGLDDDTCARAIAALRDLLASQGPLTRDEIISRLAERGVQLTGQARPHLLGRAALEGVVCFGPDCAGKPTYVLLGDWLPGWPDRPPPTDRAAALAELARRYLASHAPAAPADFAAWAGLGLPEARVAWRQIAPDLIELPTSAGPLWLPRHLIAWLDDLPARQPDAPLIRLVAGYDPYLLGYRDRALAVPPAYAASVHPGGGLLHPALLIHGLAVATWRTTRRSARVDVIVEPFEPLAPAIDRALDAEIADLARFLAIPITRG